MHGGQPTGPLTDAAVVLALVVVLVLVLDTRPSSNGRMTSCDMMGEPRTRTHGCPCPVVGTWRHCAVKSPVAGTTGVACRSPKMTPPRISFAVVVGA